MAFSTKLIARLTHPALLLGLAVALAAGVALLAYLYLQQRETAIKNELAERSQQKAPVTVRVVVPKQDAKAGTLLSGNHFVARPVEDDLVYPDTLLADDFASLEGLRLARPVLRGRPVQLSDLQQPEVNDVAAVVPAGQRAMTIDIDNLNSIAHTLRPQHRVDIFLISKAARPRHERAPVDEKSLEQATLFMQDMVVLATGREFQEIDNTPGQRASKMARPGEVEGAPPEERQFDSITLLVSPRQAARLMVGQRLGSFRVVLRGKLDREALALAPLRGAHLMPAERGRDSGIEFIVGGARASGGMLAPVAMAPSVLPPALLPPALPPQPIPALRDTPPGRL